MDYKQEIFDSVVNGKAKDTDRLVQEALAAGLGANEILKEALIPAMSEVGSRFECGRYFVPEMMISARAMKNGLAHLRPLLVDQEAKPIGKVVIGTVEGDLHDIGKNLVGMMFEGAGFQVIDLGVNVTPQKFLQTVQETDAQLVGLSALLTTTMPSMKRVVDAFKQAGLYGKVKIVVGGAPLVPDFANAIGAHGYAPDASSAASLAKRLVVDGQSVQN